MEELKRELEEYKKESSKKIKELEEKIAKMKTDKKTGRVERDEVYYYINEGGYIYDDIDNREEYDDNKYEIGNYFKTKQEAEKVLEKAIIYAKLKRFAETHNTEEIDFTFRKQVKYYLYFDYEYRKIIVDGCNEVQDIGQIYFTSEEIAKRAIEEIGEEEIKKLFF